MGVGNYSSAARRPAKAKAKSSSGHHGFLGALGNLAKDVEEAGAGFVPGLWNTGKAGVHDAGHLVGIAKGPYQTDDIARAIAHSYTDPGTAWGESGREVAALLHGDIAGFKRHYHASNKAFYDHPLGPLLDLATVATLGGAGEGKIAEIMAKAAPEGSAARIAHAAKAGLDPVTLKPATRTVQMVDGTGSFTKPLPRNTFIRGKQDLFEKASAAHPDSVFGVNRRVARDTVRTDARITARSRIAAQSSYRKALARLTNRDERKAVPILAGEHGPDRYEEFLAKRTDMLHQEIERKRVEKRGGDTGGEHVVEDHPQIGAAPNHDAGTDMVLYEHPGSHEGHASSLEIRKVQEDENLAHADKSAVDDVAGMDRSESMRRNARNLAHVEKRLAEVRRLREKGVFENPSPKLLHAVAEAKKLSEHSNANLLEQSRGSMADAAAEDEMLAQRVADRSTLESRAINAVLQDDGPVYGGAIRSHVSVTKDRLDTKVAQGASAWQEGAPLAEAQRNTGYNFLNARDSLNPAIYLQTSTNILEQSARISRHAKLLDLGQYVSRTEADKFPSSRYKVLGASSTLRKDMAEVYSLLVDAEPILAGTPGFATMKDAIARSVTAADRSEDMVFVLPNSAYNELSAGFEHTSKFVRRWIDSPTKVWRALTLNLRPAWIVNNYIGQLFLLANAYGIAGLKNYVLHSGGFTERGAWAREAAPELTEFGWANDINGDLKGAGQAWRNDPQSAVKRQAAKVVTGPVAFSRAMGRLNEYLTDSPQRAAALVSAIDPFVKQFRKAHPRMSWEDAATHLWQDDKFSNEVTQRVLGDMVDFTDLNHFERTKIKRAIPFYSWIKGAAKVGARTLRDKPWNVAGAAALANVSNAQLRAKYGQDLNAFQLGMIDGPGGRILMTQALNPFQTPVDLFTMGVGAFLPGGSGGAQNPLSQLNPVLKSPAEALARRDFFSGADLDRAGQKSLAQLTQQQAMNSLAQKKLLDDLRAKNNDSPNRVYDRNATDAVLKYLGVPVRTLA